MNTKPIANHVVAGSKIHHQQTLVCIGTLLCYLFGDPKGASVSVRLYTVTDIVIVMFL